MIPFVKTEGLGNDFILVAESDAAGRSATELARSICDRRQGVGADGLILWKPAAERFDLRIINSDGSGAECSGNGLRCVAAYLFEGGHETGDRVRLGTVSGTYTLERARGPNRYRADMGEPALAPARIPFVPDTPMDQVVNYPLDVGDRTVRVSACATGNPHCSVFVDAIDESFVTTMGPQLESHPAFPNRTNVEFIHVLNRGEIEVAFWERGAGRTPASGTGSCGATVASVLNGRTGRKVIVHAQNGDLEVEWSEGGRLILVSTATVVAEGNFHTN